MRRAAGLLRRLRAGGWKCLVDLGAIPTPAWGTWGKMETLDRFELYASWAAFELGRDTDYWLTLDQPSWAALGGRSRQAPEPGRLSQAPRLLANLMSAHGRAFRVLKRETPDLPVGLGISLEPIQPLRPQWAPDRWAAALLDRFLHQSALDALSRGNFRALLRSWALPEAKGTLDFLGLSCRSRSLWQSDPFSPGQCFMRPALLSGLPQGVSGDLIYPAGLAQALKRARGLGKPLLILDNAVEDPGGGLGPAHFVAHMEAIRPLVPEDPPLWGYIRGPLVDGQAGAYPGARGDGFFAGRDQDRGNPVRPLRGLYAEIWRENRMPAVYARQFGAALLREDAF